MVGQRVWGVGQKMDEIKKKIRAGDRRRGKGWGGEGETRTRRK